MEMYQPREDQDEARQLMAKAWELSSDELGLEEAIAAASKAWSLAPGEPGIAFKLGVMLHAAGSFEKAIEAFDRARTAGEELGEAMYQDASRLGKAASLGKLGRWVEAMDEATEVSPRASIWLGALVTPEILGRMSRKYQKKKTDVDSSR